MHPVDYQPGMYELYPTQTPPSSRLPTAIAVKSTVDKHLNVDNGGARLLIRE